jgi:hypothetical protein
LADDLLLLEQEHNENRFFVDVKKREIASYFGWLSEKGSSPARIGTLKAVLSSLSNYVELMYEDKYPNFHNQTKGIESLPPTRVRKKTVLTPDEVNGILKKLVDDKEYEIACYVALICASGCRKAEALQVKPSFFVESNEVFEGFMYKTPLVRGKGRGKAGKPMCKYVIKSIFKPYFDLRKGGAPRGPHRYSLVSVINGSERDWGLMPTRKTAEGKMECLCEEYGLQVSEIVMHDEPHAHQQEFICEGHRNRFFIYRV